MSFSPDWLALREPFDRAAREASSIDLQELAAAAAEAGASGAAYRVLDLGCGTGANFRALAPRLCGAQRWHLVDHDARLLAALPRTMGSWAQTHRLKMKDETDNGLVIEGPGWQAELSWQKADLVHDLDALPFEGSHLVTASALLDLVSASWLAALLTKVHEAQAALLCSLSVDGRIEWRPAMPTDAQMAKLFAAHQHRDKGFGGPALGADAVARAVDRLVALGYRCLQAGSDWQLAAPSGGARILVQMIDGLADAALEQDPGARDLALTWRLQRLAQSAHSTLQIGHTELLALPTRK